MTVIEQLKAKTLELRKERSTLSGIMQFHLSEMSQIGKNSGNRDTSDDEAIQYLKKAVQKLKENPHGNPDEVETLEFFLPEMASEDDVRSYIFMIETEQGLDISNKGVVMKAVKEKFGVFVDMKMVSKLL